MAAVDTSSGVPIILVTITTRVDVYRVASDPCSIAWADGDGPLQFHPGLMSMGGIQAEADLFDLTHQAAVESTRLRVVLPNAVNATQAHALYYGIAAASVDIASIWPGQDFAARVPLLEGARVVGLSLGRANEETELYLETRGPPAAASAVDASRDLGVTYPKGAGAFPDLLGKQFPVVIGHCLRVPLFRVGTAQTGGRHSGILAGHHLAPNVTVGDLTFYAAGAAAPLTTPTLNNGTDPSGNRVAWVETDIGQLGSGTDPYTVSFTTGGVASVRDSSTAVRDLGAALEWLLVNSGAKVDLLAQQRCTDLLAGWKGGVYCDRYDDLLTVIRQRVAPFLPIIERTSSRGLYYQYADPRLAPLEFALTLGQELIAPVGPVDLTDLDAIRNSFFLEYAYNHDDGTYGESISLGAADLECCRYSAQEFGVRVDSAMRCTITASDATARRMLQARAERLSLPRRMVSYIVDPSMTWLREGMVGTITDTDRGITAQRAVLRRWRPAGLPWQARFEVVDRAPVSRL